MITGCEADTVQPVPAAKKYVRPEGSTSLSAIEPVVGTVPTFVTVIP